MRQVMRRVIRKGVSDTLRPYHTNAAYVINEPRREKTRLRGFRPPGCTATEDG